MIWIIAGIRKAAANTAMLISFNSVVCIAPAASISLDQRSTDKPKKTIISPILIIHQRVHEFFIVETPFIKCFVV